MSAAAVGVVIAVRGPAPFLAEALAGVAAQTLPATQVVVVDDASPEPVRLDHAGVELVRRTTRGGPGGARNTGVGRVGTEWVAFCDADDVWSPGKLAEQARALRAGVDVCVGSAEIVDAHRRPTGERWPGLETHPEGLVAGLFAANPILLSSVVVRRAALLAVGGFDASLRRAEDWDLWLRLAADGRRFAAAPQAIVAYRRHPGGLTHDVAGLARARLELHRRHAALVSPELRRRAEHEDLLALADGLRADRDWAGARAAQRDAAAIGPIPVRHRARGAVSAVPVLRRMIGRRAPY